MDRKLTHNEQEQYHKEFGSGKEIKISYRTVIIWTMLILFLITPQLVEFDNGSSDLNPEHLTPASSGASQNQDEAQLRVYAARTRGTKGILAVHSWIAMKRAGSDEFEVSQVIGWRHREGRNVVRRQTNRQIDNWWGNKATLLVDLHGEEVEAIIDKVDAAIEDYPWSNEYTLYPGPNSNTFVAWVGLKVPELGLDLPSTAIGKDWRPLKDSFGYSASGSGLQASFLGLLGTSIGFEEGLELNILGLSFEFDLFDVAIELPLFGRYETFYLLLYVVIWISIRKWVNKNREKYIYLL